jgi:proteasome assembly chaperone (PAC2) family protein
MRDFPERLTGSADYYGVGAYELENKMDGTKTWYSSQTVWASILTMVTGLMVTMGMMTQEVAMAVVGEVPGYIVGMATTASGLWALWSRVMATKEISG